MGLFDQIVGAINNPNLQGNMGQLQGIVNTVQQLGGNPGTSPDTTQAALSMVGGYVRSALQDKRNESGSETVQSLVNQFSGTSPNQQAVEALFSTTQVQEMTAAISQKTGLSAETLNSMLPLLVPVVLNLLKMGGDPNNPSAANNSVLNSFLDTDGDGDVDMADIMKMAGGFLK